MKITCEKKELVQAIQTVLRAVPSRAEPYQERCGLRYAGRGGDTQCPSHPSLGCPAALCLLFGYDLSSFHNGTDKRSGFAFP